MLVIVTVCIFMTGERCLPESGFVRDRLHTCHERGLVPACDGICWRMPGASLAVIKRNKGIWWMPWH